ncbi:Sel1 domain protein repeat-containing protein [Seminavis robusta]|uniref:Sel1 domain protein repeat-containing protein n=1 Tax=Seminavis robusta TaxID=568900 RepID=A0A9N8DIW4_9STRA|nr:Sel1 domain protein repeat-containing protein [Seminavis robusta]|eukprot:Sro177_g077630.1 Sel1 domain protein repeat-containing protein (270) ;mRNA; r:16486-17295
MNTGSKRSNSGAGDEPQQSTKRAKKSVADDLICPISLELPWEPVTAEDGRIYERECIEEHIKKNSGNLTSPITGEKMGKKLLPAIQHRNIIETLLESGAIEEDLTAKWNEKVEQKKKMEALLEKAEAGNGYAMYMVGVNYVVGQDGFKEDEKLAFQWTKRAHEAGSVVGTAALGEHYLLGVGVQACWQKGTMYASIAAGQGSNLAAFHLGIALAYGKYGFSKDKADAIRWLEKAVGHCPHEHLSSACKNQARKKLDDLKATAAEGNGMP